MTDALIFDVDGTIADTEEAHRQSFNEAFRAFHLDWSWDVALYGELLKVTGGKERIASYIERLELPPAERRRMKDLAAQIHVLKTGLYQQTIEGGRLLPRPGVRRLMLEARAAGARLAMATTTSPGNIGPLVTVGLDPQALSWFAVIVSGDCVRNKKPAPDIYHAALKALRIAPSRAVAIEDSAIGVQAAKAAGLFTVATPSQWTRSEDLAAADLVLESLGDPQAPLGQADRRRLGADFLSFQQLAALHAAAHQGDVNAQS
jgi:HAD superfamily hydrolase (TIGR01509 family)